VMDKHDLSKMVWLLDIDGTLVLSDDIYFDTFVELLKPYGYDVDEAFYKANVHGSNDAELFRKIMPKDWTEEQLKGMSQAKDDLFCRKATERGLTIVAGLGEALELAKETGIRCIAVSNAQRGACELVLKQLRQKFAAGDVIEGLVVGAECTRAKPFPDPYLEGMKRLGAFPEQCVIFEDSCSGAKAGAAAGVGSVVGIRTSLSDADLCDVGCTVSVADWTKVTKAFLSSLSRNSIRNPIQKILGGA